MLRKRSVLLAALVVPIGCDGTPLAAPANIDPAFSAHSLPGARCMNVSGPVIASFVASGVTHPLDGDAAHIEGTTNGDVVSSAHAWVDFVSHPPADASWQGAIRIRMRHLYVAPDESWMVWTQDEGILAPLGGGVYQFNNRLRVAGGAGAFEGATGLLRSNGTVDFAQNEIRLDYHGRLCLPAE